MTDLELYTTVMKHKKLRFKKNGVECSDDLLCRTCPLGGRHNKGIMLCLDTRIQPLMDKLPELKFQYKANK